ncbi:MAG: LytTR family DNA-binding domain-containing protein [Nannocystaceae bacterium]|nr:LytTR family DNA-binding domain-containing protein [Nannocystaceae bacterium]
MTAIEPDQAIRILVVDDEPLGRRAVTRQLAAQFPHAAVHEARDGFEALEQVRTLQPQLLFLDIEMPELDGFDVLRQLPLPRPKVVFVTAFEQFALQAFEANACDYLVKPFTPERFAATCARVRTALDVDARLAALERSLAGNGGHLVRLALKLAGRVDVVAVDRVACFISRDHYTYIHADGREYISELSLVHLEERLDPARFCRVHRSAIVNLAHVVRVGEGAAAEVELDDGQRVPLSRRNRAALLARLHPEG